MSALPPKAAPEQLGNGASTIAATPPAEVAGAGANGKAQVAAQHGSDDAVKGAGARVAGGTCCHSDHCRQLSDRPPLKHGFGIIASSGIRILCCRG